MKVCILHNSAYSDTGSCSKCPKVKPISEDEWI